MLHEYYVNCWYYETTIIWYALKIYDGHVK